MPSIFCDSVQPGELNQMCCCTVVWQFPVVGLYVLSTNFFYEIRPKFDFTTMYLTDMMNGLVIVRLRHVLLRRLIHRDLD